MITREIKKHAPNVVQHFSGYSGNHLPVLAIARHHREVYDRPQDHPLHRPHIQQERLMTKAEFVEYLKKLDIKKGDIVTTIYHALEDYDKWNMYRVKDIQEIHYLAPIKAPRAGPECLILETFSGHEFTGGGDYYRRVDPAFWADEWKEKLNADANNQCPS